MPPACHPDSRVSSKNAGAAQAPGAWRNLYPIQISNPSSYREAVLWFLALHVGDYINNFFDTRYCHWVFVMKYLCDDDDSVPEYGYTLSPRFQQAWDWLNQRRDDLDWKETLPLMLLRSQDDQEGRAARRSTRNRHESMQGRRAIPGQV
ncbi:hypothetical protein BDW74DRAFT_158016 [Aspergillus multicolor]|uniref:uncharacterized protein n=1 Tax=Aspergillus multicolor TaxID=41759 RepID=UPI003CCD69D2